MGDPHDRLKVVCAFDSDLARARGTVLRPPSAVSSFGGFRTPAAEYAAPSLKRPASETLHNRRHDADYSITSSARASSVGGRVKPSAFAVLRLTTSSNRIGCSIGRSAGLAPLRILSTK